MKTVRFRFYEELNDFLPEEKRKISFEHTFIGRTSVKNMIESLGIPHSEIDLILVKGKSVDFSYIVNDRDEISVYPVFESFDISKVQHLRPQPLRKPKFIIDAGLGKLAKNLRMFGFNTTYKNNLTDEEFVAVSLKEKRAIITQNRELLKRNAVTHGYWVRSQTPEENVIEIIRRFDLKNQIKEFTRCVECNTLLSQVKKEEIIAPLPPGVQDWYNEFFLCPYCNKVYWRGSHYDKIKLFVEKVIPVI